MIPLQHHCWKVNASCIFSDVQYILRTIFIHFWENTTDYYNKFVLTECPEFGVLSWAALQLHKVFQCLPNYFWNLRRIGDFEPTLNGIWHLFSYLCHHQKVQSYFHILNSMKGFERAIQAVVLVRAILFYPCWKTWTIWAFIELP